VIFDHFTSSMKMQHTVSPKSWLLTNKGSTMLTLRCEFTYGIHVERVEQGEHDVLDSMHDGGDLLELFFYCRRIPLQAKCSSTARCAANSRMAYMCHGYCHPALTLP
jgi:hypothetical protein